MLRGASRARVRSAAPPLYAAGVSLGGNVLLKWLGRAGARRGDALVRAAAALRAARPHGRGHRDRQGLDRIYAWHFLRTLKPKALAMARRFPGLFDRDRIAPRAHAARLRRRRHRAAARLRDADDYWTRASSQAVARRRRGADARCSTPQRSVPARRSLPGTAEVAPRVQLEQPRHGGHVGFLTGPLSGRIDGCRGACSTSSTTALKSVRRPAIVENSLPIDRIPSPRNLQGLRHPRHRRQDAHRRRSSEPIGRGARHARARKAARHVRRRPRRPALGPALAAALARRLCAAGVDVIDIGVVATPMVYFATHHLEHRQRRDGHRQPQPARVQRPQDDGRRRHARPATTIQDAAQAHRGAASSRRGSGHATRSTTSREAYLERIIGDVKLARPMKIAVDCGNGVAGAFAPDALPRAWAAR